LVDGVVRVVPDLLEDLAADLMGEVEAGQRLGFRQLGRHGDGIEGKDHVDALLLGSLPGRSIIAPPRRDGPHSTTR